MVNRQNPAKGKSLPMKDFWADRVFDVILQEHFEVYGSPNAYTALPAAIATYSFPSTANAMGAA
jgi:hypothetical protein